jgi:hypothetical protein
LPQAGIVNPKRIMNIFISISLFTWNITIVNDIISEKRDRKIIADFGFRIVRRWVER